MMSENNHDENFEILPSPKSRSLKAIDKTSTIL